MRLYPKGFTYFGVQINIAMKEEKKLKIHRLWCQHCKAMQKANNTAVECWYNPLDEGRENAFCASSIDAVNAIEAEIEAN